jgi:3-phosphoshikimate 1-carboxyvinyltransferase
VTVPSSKSIAHREIIAAALSGVEAPLVRGESKDTLATPACINAMMSGEKLWPCGESGSTMRFLTPLAGVMGWQGEFKCEGRLAERPQMPFEKRDCYEIAGNVSSQFISGLLMALPLAAWDSRIVVKGKLESSAYVELTEDVLLASGIKFEKGEGVWEIKGGQKYRIAGGREVEGDWSQAAFFLAMGVEVDGLKADSKQGDRAVTRLMSDFEVDVSPVPDLVPALAVHAAAREGTTRFFNCARLRLKESDRLESTFALVNSVGAKAYIEGDVLKVVGRSKLAGGEVRSFGDHRIAMAAAVAACYSSSPVVVDDGDVVAKSYPGFWNDFDKLQVDEK